jgi:hypothetical protein
VSTLCDNYAKFMLCKEPNYIPACYVLHSSHKLSDNLYLIMLQCPQLVYSVRNVTYIQSQNKYFVIKYGNNLSIKRETVTNTNMSLMYFEFLLNFHGHC